MSLLYKKREELEYKVDIDQEDGIIRFMFWANCGKHGTDEVLDGYNLSPKRLLDILQDRDDYQEHEL